METQTPIPSLLALPVELRQQIFEYLLTPKTQHLIIRSLFIRAYYRNVFMSQQPKGISIALLTVCKQITDEALPILYSTPLWRCACRFENLASQIGMQNFNLVRRMHIDADDLPLVVRSLKQDQRLREMREEVATEAFAEITEEERTLFVQRMAHYEQIRRLRFVSLEMLLVEGYQAVAITSVGDQRAREEALNLCKLAREITTGHPSLSILVQRDKRGNGGSDALDLTMGRVRWRFLRYERDILPGEHIVDLEAMIEMIQEIIEHDHKEGVRRKSSLPTGWTDTGVFEQYPYLPGRTTSIVLQNQQQAV